MKKTKFTVLAVSVALLLSSCGGVSNTAKGGMIGGASGGALGALIGQLIGNGKGAAIGAAVGATVGGATGVIIGHKMDKAKAAAEAANAQAEVLTDANGTQYVKATFDSGLLFATGSSTLSAEAKASIQKFVTQLAAEDNTFNLAVCGYTDNAGWANSTVAQSQQKNLNLSQQRAESVKGQITAAGYPAARLVHVQGYGESNPVASNETAAGKAQNRRVEVYILPSKEMIAAAQQQ